jgi:hypothetical protein
MSRDMFIKEFSFGCCGPEEAVGGEQETQIKAHEERCYFCVT